MSRIRSIVRCALPAVICFGVAAAGLLLGAGTANAATGYGPYYVLASPTLNERSAPSTSASIVGSLSYGSAVDITCQTSGSLVYASTVWDQLTNGRYVSDYFMSTPGIDGFSSNIPRCGSPIPPPPGASWGQTVSYNEGGSGECTWWAINEFHAYTGVYPDLTDSDNSGDAKYWAGNAVYRHWTVSATPRVDSIAVFPAWVNGAGSYGHVAWVTAVSGDVITVSEMNFDAWNQVDTRTLVPASSVRFILAP